MSETRPLELEILSGPLDGHVILLDAAGAWGRGGKGPLRFPWDGELGAPQARFAVDDEGWWLEGLEAPRGTYRVNREEKVRQKVLLKRGDLLKASETWLVVREA